MGLGLSNMGSQRTVCKDNKKADIRTIGLMAMRPKLKTFRTSIANVSLPAPVEMSYFY